jgi:hypothetical protein
VTKLPLLARIHVATPCTADWSQMTGDERVRHCAHCKKDVFNLSDMSRAQAERLIIERNGDLCARYYQRKDGTVLLADCSVGIKQKRKSRVIAAGAAALLAGTGGTAGYLKLRHPEKLAVTIDRSQDFRMGTAAVEPPLPDVQPLPELDPPPDVHEIKGQMIAMPPPHIDPVRPKMGKLKVR